MQITMAITAGKLTSFSHSCDLAVKGIASYLGTATGAAHIAASYKNLTY